MSVRPVVHSHRQTLAFVSIAFQVVEESYRFRASPPWAVNEIEFQNATVLWRVSTCPRGRSDAVSQPVLHGVHLHVTADSANGSRVHRRPDLHFLPNQDEDEKPQHKSLIGPATYRPTALAKMFREFQSSSLVYLQFHPCRLLPLDLPVRLALVAF